MTVERVCPGGLAILVAVATLAACSRPVPVRPAATGEKEAPACAPCECEACPACPAVAASPERATPAAEPSSAEEPAPAEPLVVPEHLRPTPEQCKGACDRLLEAEARRVANRIQGAQPDLVAALNQGLAAEKGLLAASCQRRCLAEFTVNTALCVRKFEALEQVQRCVVETSLPTAP